MQHLRFLHYVDAVARAGSIRGAADRCTSPRRPSTAACRTSRRNWATPIFERLPRGVRLTAAGELFVAYARRRSADLDQVRSQIEDLRGVRRGQVAIAASQAVAPASCPAPSWRSRPCTPAIAFDVKVLDRERGVQDVLDFAADLALVFNPDTLRGLQVLAQPSSAPAPSSRPTIRSPSGRACG
jgi:DNA-binding transcriptional LysR family regulator